jgi:hypothetical protein
MHTKFNESSEIPFGKLSDDVLDTVAGGCGGKGGNANKPIQGGQKEYLQGNKNGPDGPMPPMPGQGQGQGQGQQHNCKGN